MEFRPYLLVDIDGVLSPYGPESCPDGFTIHLTPNMPEDGTLGEAWFCRAHGEWLRELAVEFELVWASAWGYTANEVLAPILELPAVDHVPFPPLPFRPEEKVPAIAAYVEDRPAAWIDDLLVPEAWTWARSRAVPTLLMPIDPRVGLTRADVDALLAWVRELKR